MLSFAWPPARAWVLALLILAPPAGANAPVGALDARTSEQPVAETKPTKKPKKEAKEKAKGKAKEKATSETKSNKKSNKDSKRKSQEESARFGGDVEVDARLGVGGTTGEGVYALPSLVSIAEVALEPMLKLDLGFAPLHLSLPARLAHRETFAAPLRRTRAEVEGVVATRPWRELRADVAIGVGATEERGWPDRYQPDDSSGDGDVILTDRFSHDDVWIGAHVLAIPLRLQFFRLKYEWRRRDYPADPSFDAIERPNHLTPRDRDEHTLATSWRGAFGALKPGVAAAVFRREWFFVFARDAQTGATHAGAGGDPPNPLLVLHGLELEPEVQLELLDETVELHLAWRLRLIEDSWQGYASRTENRVVFDVEARFFDSVALFDRALRTDVRGRLELDHWLYTTNGYAANPDAQAGRPPLDFGAVRERRHAALSIIARVPAHSPVHLFLDLSVNQRATNFPDYAPGIAPANQSYAIDWDWQHAQAIVGIELREPRQ